jgi:tRNA A64-2'-O-ribosylphosphate transferase
MPEPQYKDLIFPSQSAQPSLSSLLTSLRTRNLSIHNRLTSIRTDASFILHVASLFPTRPLIANERCGSWYIPPENKGGSAYFKSTDGHERAWKFSTRRLNLHLVDTLEQHDG